MSDLQAWFAPLIWIIGTITALAAFIRLCKPLWSVVQTPKILSEQMAELKINLSEHSIEITNRLDKYDEGLVELKTKISSADRVHLSLLRNGIISLYYSVLDRDDIPDDIYRTICDMFESYTKEGGNSYIVTVMEHVEELYKASQEDRRRRNRPQPSGS